MKTLTILPFLAIAIFSAQSQHVPSANPIPDTIGRYQMTATTLDNGEKTVFLLDTATGKVWKYQNGFTSTETGGTTPVFNPPRFISIPVDDLTK